MKELEYVVTFNYKVTIVEEELLKNLSDDEFELFESGKLNIDIINERLYQLAKVEFDETLNTVEVEEFDHNIKKQKSI